MRDDLRVVDGGDHGGTEAGTDEDQQHRTGFATPGQHQDDESERGHGQTPARQPMNDRGGHPL